MLIEKYFLLRSKYVINMAILDHSSTFYDAFFFQTLSAPFPSSSNELGRTIFFVKLSEWP